MLNVLYSACLVLLGQWLGPLLANYPPVSRALAAAGQWLRRLVIRVFNRPHLVHSEEYQRGFAAGQAAGAGSYRLSVLHKRPDEIQSRSAQ